MTRLVYMLEQLGLRGEGLSAAITLESASFGLLLLSLLLLLQLGLPQFLLLEGLLLRLALWLLDHLSFCCFLCLHFYLLYLNSLLCVFILQKS